jgi:protein O-GlcNAc transferase
MTDTLLKNAMTLHQAGQFAQAARLYAQVLEAEPMRFDALYSLGLALLQQGDFASAERVLSDAIGVNGSAAQAHMTRGVALSQLSRHDDALLAYDRALALKPGNASIWNNRGHALLKLGRPADAMESYERAIGLRPDLADGWRNLGLALSILGRAEEALESLNRALALVADFPDALEDRADILMKLGRREEAQAAYAKAIAARPGSAHLHYNRANALSILRRYGEAIVEAQAALAIDPDYPYARGVLVHSRLQACDWETLEDEKAKIAAAIMGRKRSVSPFNHKAISDSPEEQLFCARAWVANERPAGIVPYTHAIRRGGGRIRLAYVSADFNASAVASVMAGVFERHDRGRFETYAISFGRADGTAMRARLEADFDRFIDVRTKSDAEIAALMRDEKIDIAVDLMGYTGECRSWILTHRPAPVQVNFLGFAGTMGAEHIDYIVADKWVIPEDMQIHYAERIAYLPHCYLPGDGARRVSAPPSRAQAGLPEKGFVFASFNNAYKFAPAMFDVWMRLLNLVPDSVLWLPRSEPETMANLKREAQARGVAGKRLYFAPLVPAPEDHLARMSLADLFLDTLPYNAHSTALDALLAGVPVLTAPGNGFQGRVAASLVSAAGLPELIAPDLTGYERMALEFARAPDALAALRDKLSRARKSAPLFDTGKFTRDLESAFLLMWERFERGEAPAAFAVSPS